MKIIKFLGRSCLIFVIMFGLFLAPFSTYALSAEKSRLYSQYNIYFYDDTLPYEKEEFGPCESACAADGDDRIAVIWNHIIGLGISGVSDNPAVIAGVIGNMSHETGGHLNPFRQNESGYTGLIQWSPSKADFHNRMRAKGYDKYYYVGSSEPNIDEAIVREAIIFEVDYLFNDFPDTKDFIAKLNIPTNKTGAEGARAYADLFLITVERAVGGSDEIEDPGVKSSAPSSRYQGAEDRRDRAEDIYDKYGDCEDGDGYAPDSGSDSGDTSDLNVTWTNGFIDEGTFPGYNKEVPSPGWADETENRPYSTNGPNKILLHSTEGQQAGLAAYPSGNHYAAHFTLDPKNKRVYQHYSINTTSNAIKTYDQYAGVQIEIVAFSQGHEDNKYSFRNYTDDDWDYVALLLGAISQKTGIPLTSSVDWSHPARLPLDAFKSYSGVLGHMHATANDHVDPGNIWGYIEAALGRNPGLGDFHRPCVEQGESEEVEEE